jgi:hypothetical protein
MAATTKWRLSMVTADDLAGLVAMGWISAEQGEAIKATPQA